MSRKLKLKRPLAVFDLETTGTVLDTDRIVEIGIIKVHPDGRKTKLRERVNPGIPIPLGAYMVHGICDDDVKRKPKFRKIALKVNRFLRDCDLAGFNSIKFDIPMLLNEFERAKVPFSLDGRRLLDALHIFHLKERRDLTAAYSFYCHKMHEEAHSALGDARVCWQVLQAQLVRYKDLSLDLDALHDLCTEKERYADVFGKRFEWIDGEASFRFGKHQGKLLKTVAKETPDYLQWMLGSDFTKDTMDIARDALDGKFPSKQQA
jgi:DNA polymerase-3 subunit epsilon